MIMVIVKKTDNDKFASCDYADGDDDWQRQVCML